MTFGCRDEKVQDGPLAIPTSSISLVRKQAEAEGSQKAFDSKPSKYLDPQSCRIFDLNVNPKGASFTEKT